LWEQEQLDGEREGHQEEEDYIRVAAFRTWELLLGSRQGLLPPEEYPGEHPVLLPRLIIPATRKSDSKTPPCDG